ncbi:MAG: lipid-A-disaccharide synthase, partial [Bacteroidia bacterium]
QLYDSITAGTDIRVVYDDTYSVLRLCELALVTSGTATLETALAAVPQVVCYITNPVTYTLAKAFLKIRFISLVNLIMDREVVRELIQDELNDHNLAVEINSIMSGGWKREVMMAGYRELSASLDGKGSGEKVSMDIYQSLCLIKNVN